MWDKEFTIEAAALDGRLEQHLQEAHLTGYTLPVTELPPIERTGRSAEIDGRPFNVIEGDLLLDPDELLLSGLAQDGPVPDHAIGGLIGMSFGGEPVRWEPGRILTYAVLKSSFGSPAEYEEVRAAMKLAAEAWQDACDVTFEHLEEFDSHGDPSTQAEHINHALLFTVRKADAKGAFIASAFFRTQPPERRKIYIDPSFFTTDFDHVGVLRHELGHVLGFRHEHIATGAPAVCPDEPEFGQKVELTRYDPKSVMHYFCGGVGSKTLELTKLDVEGARVLYGPPRRASKS